MQFCNHNGFSPQNHVLWCSQFESGWASLSWDLFGVAGWALLVTGAGKRVDCTRKACNLSTQKNSKPFLSVYLSYLSITNARCLDEVTVNLRDPIQVSTKSGVDSAALGLFSSAVCVSVIEASWHKTIGATGQVSMLLNLTSFNCSLQLTAKWFCAGAGHQDFL